MTSGVPVSIIARRSATTDEWEQACRACDYATFFHTPLWASVFTRVARTGMAPSAQIVEFSDGASALLPLTCRGFFGGLFRVYWSMPACTYGGWLSAGALTKEHCREMVTFMRSFPNLVWRENPYDPVLKTMDLHHAVDDFTQTIDLTNGFDRANARCDYSHRRAVRQARESGVTISEASNFEEWISYFSLYKDSRVRWREKGLLRSRGYSREQLRIMFEVPAEHRKLWLAKLGDMPIAGTLCFYWNRHAVSWSAAGRADYFHRYRPNDLLYDRAIDDAAKAGYRWFDCNPSGGFQGVVDFKQHIGAQKIRCRIVNNRSPVRRCADLIRSVLP
jgi:hypothetical protein